ncbi:Crp/Fnr family transcriptional regulator [Xanthomonas bonasiae]|uniref:Crp/Fnr family transcriptional regulator n=1 Tax=Xanthomonas bonasiae TaxID=2810351 RepID=UPI00197F7794|nr:Crp/Fnr family transcriptional regulator [Xanthomonas bonasiae]MBN6110592.1 Crp/Fnr family transcriptional regulator [Xanthomonas bonasiae]
MEPNSLIPQELLKKLVAVGETRRYAPRDILVSEGDLADAVYILVSGKLKVFTCDSRGRELVYNVMRPGEFFGEMLLDGGRRSASVKSAEPSECIVIAFAEFRAFMEKNAALAEFLIVTLIRRLRHATDQARSLALSGVYERLVDLLNAEAVEQDGQRLIPAALTQREMSARVGATREMVNHVIRDLLRGGFIAKNEGARW